MTHFTKIRFRLLIFVLLGLGAITAPSAASECERRDDPRLEDAIVKLVSVEKNKHDDGLTVGTGFFLDDRGSVLTVEHVAPDGDAASLFAETLDGKLRWPLAPVISGRMNGSQDEAGDWLVLKIGSKPPLQLKNQEWIELDSDGVVLRENHIFSLQPPQVGFSPYEMPWRPRFVFGAEPTTSAKDNNPTAAASACRLIELDGQNRVRPEFDLMPGYSGSPLLGLLERSNQLFSLGAVRRRYLNGKVDATTRTELCRFFAEYKNIATKSDLRTLKTDDLRIAFHLRCDNKTEFELNTNPVDQELSRAIVDVFKGEGYRTIEEYPESDGSEEADAGEAIIRGLRQVLETQPYKIGAINFGTNDAAACPLLIATSRECGERRPEGSEGILTDYWRTIEVGKGMPLATTIAAAVRLAENSKDERIAIKRESQKIPIFLSVDRYQRIYECLDPLADGIRCPVDMSYPIEDVKVTWRGLLEAAPMLLSVSDRIEVLRRTRGISDQKVLVALNFKNEAWRQLLDIFSSAGFLPLLPHIETAWRDVANVRRSSTDNFTSEFATYSVDAEFHLTAAETMLSILSPNADLVHHSSTQIGVRWSMEQIAKARELTEKDGTESDLLKLRMEAIADTLMSVIK